MISDMVLQASQIPLYDISMGQAVLIVGLMALILWATVRYSNPAGGVAWALTALVLVVGGLLEVGFEVYWLSVVGTLMIVATGIVVRWSYR